MRFYFASAVALVAAHSLCAADLTGKWVVAPVAGPGRAGAPATPGAPPLPANNETAYYITATGNSFSGYLSQGQTNSPITDGKIDGDDVTFTIVRSFGGNDTKVAYTAKLADDTLTIAIPAAGGRGGGGGRGRGPAYGFGTPPAANAPATPPQPAQQIARRVSTAAPPPMPVPPAKVTLKPPPDGVKYNGLATTPPMGWNSWNKFQARVSDQVVREITDAMVKNGMRDAGYIYVNIDDTWEGTRDEKGNIRSNEKFPDMKALADYVHSKGMKLGIYSSPGPKTCAGYEGSYQHEEQDAKTFAAWGIDYLKYDWCSATQVYTADSQPGAYSKMGQALLDAGLDSGRSILYSLCQYGQADVGTWGANAGGNLWRTTGDISDNWVSMSNIGFDQQIGLEKFAGRGHWNDPDMLEIGNGGMNDTEYRTHMSLWSLLAAPLLAGNDLRSVAPDILEILTNKEVIAIDQDVLGEQGVRVSKDEDAEVWVRSLDGGVAVGLFNRGRTPLPVTAAWSTLGITGTYKVRDLWAHSDRGSGTDAFWATVQPHGVVLLKLTK
jgi:alpha-galactosidase